MYVQRDLCSLSKERYMNTLQLTAVHWKSSLVDEDRKVGDPERISSTRKRFALNARRTLCMIDARRRLAPFTKRARPGRR